MSPWQAFIADSVFTLRKHKEMAEKAFSQLDDEAYFRKLGENSNSVAVIIKHLAGNLHSRWSEFLTTDGEKPWRNRDTEFVIGPDDSRDRLMAAWQEGWATLFHTLAELKEEDFLKPIRIRGEEHTVLQAVQRSLAHAVYHIGQIVYLARLLTTGAWQWITIPPGESKNARKYL